MLKLVVLDRSAESRNKIIEQITGFLRLDIPELDVIPRIDLKPLSSQELKFHAAPDVCIIGEEIITADITEIGRIKKLLPDTPLLVRINQKLAGISTIEQLARFGADDTMPVEISAAEFLRKIIILSRRKVKVNSGKLIIVDSGKGGLGVTSVAAGVAEALMERGKKTVLIDLDFETQDLSRFLQTRPFINENLQMLLDRTKPVTQECVEQCLVRVWEDEENLYCLPPVAECEELFDLRTAYSRVFISVLEMLDILFDCIVVDAGCARGAILKTVYRVADHCLFLVNNDPACLYASASRLGRVRSMMAPGAGLLIADNNSSRLGLPAKVLRTEFSRAAGIEDACWLDRPIQHCKIAFRWPGSGASIYSQGKYSLAGVLNSIIEVFGLVDYLPRPGEKHRFNFWPAKADHENGESLNNQTQKCFPSLEQHRLLPDKTSEEEEKTVGEGQPESLDGASLNLINGTDRAEGQANLKKLISGVSLC